MDARPSPPDPAVPGPAPPGAPGSASIAGPVRAPALRPLPSRLRAAALRTALLGVAFAALSLTDVSVRSSSGVERLAVLALVSLGLGGMVVPVTIAETHLEPGRPWGAAAALLAWLAASLVFPLALVQLVYCLTMLESGSIDRAAHEVVALLDQVRRDPAPLLVGPLLAAILVWTSAARARPGRHTGFLVLTFPSGLVLLGLFALADAVERRLWAPRAPAVDPVG